MKKFLTLLLLCLSFALFTACDDSDEETLEGAEAENVMWLLNSTTSDASPSTQYWQYKDGNLNTYYDNAKGKYYYPADAQAYTLDDEALTLTYGGYTFTYELSEDGETFSLTCGSWTANFTKATVDPSEFTAYSGNAGKLENPFLKFLASIQE